jgi:spermidine dehydrogenase
MSDDRDLGLHASITRKDFLNATLLGVGGLLLSTAAPAFARAAAGRAQGGTDEFTGYGGTGDYARSNGNTKPVLDAAHRVREKAFTSLGLNSIADTGEIYDVVVVGGGIAGLAAAYTVAKTTERRKTCLVIENHPIFGGGAKQNEFMVRGVRLVGPQASNQFGVPGAGGTSIASQAWTDFGLPRSFTYQAVDASVGDLKIPLDNYAHMDGVNETQVDVGYYFDERSGAAKPVWLRNIWRNDLADTPFSPEVRADLLRWRRTNGETTDEFRRRLDTMTYAQYLEGELKLRPDVSRFAAPIVGLINGASPDGVSAFASAQIGMPGVARVRSQTGPLPQSFPGGNSAYARHFVKWLVPDGISGEPGLEGVHNGRVDTAALDRKGQPVRIRLSATVFRVEHASSAADGEHVIVAYEQNGKPYRVRARAVVMASGGGMSRSVLTDMPAEMRDAYATFQHAPALVVNVALDNWRFLRALDIACARWFDDEFGFSCNIRRPMVIGATPAPMTPDDPAVLTFYMGLYAPGRPAGEQGQIGRKRLLETSYADFERLIRRKMTTMFGRAGFDARRDIAGIVLNRWGHARVVQPPGFYYGRDGRTSAREIVAKGYGRIAIGHSELGGHQSATGAMTQGARAAREALTTGAAGL